VDPPAQQGASAGDRSAGGAGLDRYSLIDREPHRLARRAAVGGPGDNTDALIADHGQGLPHGIPLTATGVEASVVVVPFPSQR